MIKLLTKCPEIVDHYIKLRQPLRVLIALAVLFSTANAMAALDLRNASTVHLDNGLTVVLLQDRNFPLTSVQMLYRIGARDEVTAKTGLAHFLEHMAFRDSDNFPDNALVNSIYAHGGEWHGYTWTDETTYFATVPNEHLDLLLRIEADRMSRLSLSPGDMEAERGAVLAELHMYENDPVSMLFDAIMFTAFLAHPYRNNTIGWQSDIEHLTHTDVVSFYKDHYQPANAVLVVVGDIDREKTFARIKALFGSVPGRAPKPPPLTIEPRQNGERRIHLRGNGDSRHFMIGYHAPSASHPDFAAFLVLQEILGAGSGVNFLQNDWGTAVRADSLLAGAANDLSTWYPPSAQDYLFVIAGSAATGENESDIEEEIEKRIHGLRQHPPAFSALTAAINRTLDELVFDVETTEDAAHQLAFFEGLHALDTLLALPDQIKTVTAADVQRIAQNWLQPERRTIAWYLPHEPATVAAIEAPPARQAGTSRPAPVQAVDLKPLPQAVLRKLGSGIPVIVQAADLSAAIHLQIILPGTNLESDSALKDEPIAGYSSLILHGRTHELVAKIEETRTALQQAQYTTPDPQPASTDPETRLEQTFAQHMAIANKTQSGEVKPALIVLAGDVEAEAAFNALEQAFGSRAAWSGTASTVPLITNGELKVKLGITIAQAQLGYIVSAPGPEQRGYEATRFLQYILAHDYGGRLGKEAISKRGLAYYIDSRYRSDGTNGWLTLGIGVDTQKIDALKALMKNELQRLQTDPPTITEIEEARSYLLGRARSAAQSNAELANDLARQWLWHGELPGNESLERRLAAVSRSDVLAFIPAFINGMTIIVTR